MNKKLEVFNEHDLLIKKDGLIYNKDGFPFTGTYIGSSGSGFPSGILKAEYKNGLKDGCQEEFNYKEELEKITNYKKGNLHGPYEIYFDYSNGKLYKKGAYKDGKEDGTQEIYEQSGGLCQIYTYKNGELHGLHEYWNSNTLHTKGHYKNGKHHGSWFIYYESGELKSIINYKEVYKVRGYYG